MAIQKMLLDGMEIWVEVDDRLPIDPAPSSHDLMKGYTEISTATPDPAKPFEILKSNIKGLTAGIKAAIEQAEPSEFEVEFAFKFAGKTNWVPLLVSSTAEATVTVKAIWKDIKKSACDS